MHLILEPKMNIQEKYQILETIFALMPGHVYWKDVQGRYLACNNKQAETLGLSSRHDIVGKTDEDLPWKEQANRLQEIDNKVVTTRKEFTEEEIVYINGEKRIFLSRKVPLLSLDGGISGILGISFDITERKRMEEQLVKAKEQAEISNKVKTGFLRNMEHDIRTPFSGIIGITDYLYQNEDNPQKKELLADTLGAAKELMNFCDNVLDFARQEFDHVPIIEKTIDITALVNSILVTEVPSAKAKKLKLLSHIDPNIPEVVIGDIYRLQRILINLLGNSIKFTEQGYVKLSIEMKNKLSLETVILRFIIEDTGIGIPDDKKEIIYEKFSKIEPSNTGLYKGLGLGLRTVKQFIKELEGDISLKSTPNKGTTFTLDIPFKLPSVDKGSNKSDV